MTISIVSLYRAKINASLLAVGIVPNESTVDSYIKRLNDLTRWTMAERSKYCQEIEYSEFDAYALDSIVGMVVGMKAEREADMAIAIKMSFIHAINLIDTIPKEKKVESPF